MSVNIAETFGSLLDKNNDVAYKALQELQKQSEETDCVYPYMDRSSDMLDSDDPYIRTRGLTLLAYNANISIYEDNMQSLVYKDIQKALKVIQRS